MAAVELAPVLHDLIGAVGGGGIVGALAWLREKERAKASSDSIPSKMVGEAAEFQKYLNEHSERAMAGMQADVERLKADIQDLKEENLRCRSDANQLKQHVESLEAILRDEGINIPHRKLDRSFTVFEAGRTTTMRADSCEDDPPTEPYRPRRKK